MLGQKNVPGEVIDAACCQSGLGRGVQSTPQYFVFQVCGQTLFKPHCCLIVNDLVNGEVGDVVRGTF